MQKEPSFARRATIERVALLAIVLLGLALRLARLDRFSIWLDEAASRYLVRVHRLREGDRFVAFDQEAGI